MDGFLADMDVGGTFRDCLVVSVDGEVVTFNAPSSTAYYAERHLGLSHILRDSHKYPVTNLRQAVPYSEGSKPKPIVTSPAFPLVQKVSKTRELA